MRAHQYVDRATGGIVDERLFGDRLVRFLYSRARERAPWLLAAATSRRASSLLALLNFDLPLAPRLLGNRGFLRRCGVDLGECVGPPESFTTPRRIFERQIRYWECRPLPDDPTAVVSPCDARVAVASLAPGSALFLKGKLFTLEELLGPDRREWSIRFAGGEAAVCRLTPEKYHYNHWPVAGTVVDLYALDGAYHSCHPRAVVELATPFSKNRRTVAVVDTDVPGGTGVGRVAMIEVVALMIGEVVQATSRERYEDPAPALPDAFVARGSPKSLFRPGSSTVVLLFEPGRVEPAADLAANALRTDVASALARGFGQPLVETEVAVRSAIAWPLERRNP